MRGAITSNYREVISGLSTVTNNAEYLTSTNGRLNVNAGGSGTVIGDVRITDGTNISSVVAGDTGYNGIATAAGSKTYAFTTSGTGAQRLGPYSSEGFAWVQVQYTSVGTGVSMSGQFSLDGGTTWMGANSFQSAASTSSVTGALVATANIFTSRVWGSSFSLNFTAISTGPVAGTILFTNAPLQYSTLGVAAAQVGTWTMQPGNTPNTTPWLVSAAQVYSIGGSLKALTPSANRISTNTTTTITAATVYVSSITIVADVAGTTSTVTIQDKSGTPLKLVNGLTTVAITTTPSVFNFQVPVLMTGGIDIVTAGAVAATVDVWVGYYQ